MSGVFPSLESRTASVRGLTLHYMIGGRGMPLVLVHGLGSSASLEWRFNLEALAAEFRVLAPDLPGFGASDKPALAYTIAFFVETLKDFVAAQGLDRLAIMGASYGGRIALGLALELPGVVERLVLVDALGVGRPRRDPAYALLQVQGIGELMLGGAERVLARFRPAVVRRFWGWYLRRPRSMARILTDSRIADQRRMLASPDYRAAYLATLRAVTSLRRLRDGVMLDDRLHEVSIPTLLVWGRHDHIFPAREAEAARPKFSDARLVVFEDCGHTPQLEDPDRFNRVVLDFLKG